MKDTKWQTKSLLKAYQISPALTVLEVFLLVFLGAAAVLIRSKLRIPLNLPGHHGVEVMALFIFGRGISRLRMASSISAVAAGVMIFFPLLGFKDPYLPFIFLAMGAMLDFLYGRMNEMKPAFIFIPLLAGLSYSLIPLSRLLIHVVTAYPYMLFVKFGYILPVVTHFLFGLVGGIIALLMIKTYRKSFTRHN